VRHLFVSQEFPPETGWGGIGTYVDIISEAMAAKDADVHVLSVVPGQESSRKSVDGVTVHRQNLPTVRGAGRLPPEAWRRFWLPLNVARLIKRLDLRPDVVECPEWSAEGWVMALRGSVPLVIRMHSGARQLFPYSGQGRGWRGLDGRLSTALEESSVRRANVITATESVLAELAAPLRLEREALHSITYPMRPSSVPVTPIGEVPRITFLGRFEPRKGPDVVLRAVPRVLSAVPEARFSFVGRDARAFTALGSASWLRSEAERLGVSHAVEIREAFGRKVVEAELQRSTICVVPSRWESFGYTAAEAMAAERPVVVSPIPAFREMVTDGVTGRVAALNDPDAWSDVLIELLRHPALARDLARAGASHVARLTDPSRIADLTLQAHEHAIERWCSGRRAGRPS